MNPASTSAAAESSLLISGEAALYLVMKEEALPIVRKRGSSAFWSFVKTTSPE